jgi:uncharacterized protein
MFSPHPELIDPWRAVAMGAEYTGTLALSSLPRLVESLRNPAGEAGFKLIFARDPEGRGVLTGEIEARLILTCQRCLGAMTLAVRSPLSLALVSGLDEALLLPEELDPLLVPEEPLRLRDLIEDELLLALPQIARHEPGECDSGQGQVEKGEEAQGGAGGPHPFAILGALSRGQG